MSTIPADSQPKLPKLAVAAAITSFLLAAVGLLSVIKYPFLVLSAAIPLIAGIEILRRRVSSAYGFALFQLAQLMALLLLLPRVNTFPRTQVVFSIFLNVGLAILFFLAGRSLAAVNAPRGSLVPWILLACVFTVPLFFFQAFVVPTGGMEDTLLIGDRIAARTFPPVHPVVGDIVIFRYPPDRHQVFIKRVVGLPGDRIRMVSRILYRNGSALREPYAVHKFYSVDKYRDNFPGNPSDVPAQPGMPAMLAAQDMLRNHVANGEVVVPPGKYFVLGDNRDNSLDSRYWGFVDASDLIGEPVLVYYSDVPVGSSSLTASSPTAHHIRWNRVFKLL